MKNEYTDTMNTQNLVEANNKIELKTFDFTEKEAEALKPVLMRFMKEYEKKRVDESDETWLVRNLQRELPEKSLAEVQDMSKAIIQEVARFDRNLASVNEACNNGKTKEEWFRDKAQEAAVGMSVNEYGAYLQRIDEALEQSNMDLIYTITTGTGDINMNPNLDGFLAEQQTVSSFNEQAALQNSPYRAEVLFPTGRYGKNSVDIVIRDTQKTTHNIVRRYQMKFGKDADATAKYIKNGDYRGQRIVVPKGQGEAVEDKIASQRDIKEYIESPDGVRSKPITKEQIKKKQIKLQKEGEIEFASWNSYNTRELAYQLGKQAVLSGVMGAAVGTGVNLAVKCMQGEKIDKSEVLQTALETGTDAGVKSAATAALKVAAERSIPVLNLAPVSSIATIACVGVETVKIGAQYAEGKINGVEAIDKVGRMAASNVYGLSWGASGATIGAAALSWVPVAGTLVGGCVGGMVGYMAGSKWGETMYRGVKEVAGVAKTVAKTAVTGIKAIGNGIKNLGSKLLSWL